MVDPQRVRIWGRYRSFNWVASTHTWCACTRSPVIINTAVPLVPPPAPRCRQQYYIIHVVHHAVHKFKFICIKKNYMYNIHVCIELAVWCYGEEAAAIVQAESDAGKASMHNAGGEELISLSGHRASVGVRGKIGTGGARDSSTRAHP